MTCSYSRENNSTFTGRAGRNKTSKENTNKKKEEQEQFEGRKKERTFLTVMIAQRKRFCQNCSRTFVHGIHSWNTQSYESYEMDMKPMTGMSSDSHASR